MSYATRSLAWKAGVGLEVPDKPKALYEQYTIGLHNYAIIRIRNPQNSTGNYVGPYIMQVSVR